MMIHAKPYILIAAMLMTMSTSVAAQTDITLDDTSAGYTAFKVAVYSQPKDTEFNITYTRNTYMEGSNGGTTYGTICLPFQIKGAQTGLQLFYFGTISGSTLNITPVAAADLEEGIHPCTPLIFKLDSPATSMTITSTGAKVTTDWENPVIEKTWLDGNAIEKGSLWIKGIETQQDMADPAKYYYIYNDCFYKANNKLTVPPFRVVMYYNDQTPGQSKPAFFNIQEQEGSTTGISTVPASPSAAASTIFDINGRKQQSLHKGLNIVRHHDGSITKVIVAK